MSFSRFLLARLAESWLAIKERRGLWMTVPETRAVWEMLETCD